MNLSQLMQGLFKNEQIPVSANATSDVQMSASLMARIRALSPGQIISGEVMGSEGGLVKLLVGGEDAEKFLISAKMTQNIALAKGKHVLFEVKNNGKVLSLSPLFENTGMDANVSKAITAANLTMNEETVSLVQHMMEEGMPVNKENLASISQDVNRYANANIQDVLDLHKLGMPVNEESLKQIAAYKEQSHQLLGAVQVITDNIVEEVIHLAQNGDAAKAVELLKGIMDVFAFTEDGVVADSANDEMVMAQQSAPSVDSMTEGVHGESANVPENAILQEAQSREAVLPQTSEAGNILKQLLFAKDMESAISVIKDKDSVKHIKEFLEKELLFDTLDVADKEAVKSKYKKLYEFVTKAEESLSRMMLTDSKVYEAVSETKQNIQFLNQLNEMYAYIQIPLKMISGDTNGELYVYSNKRSLADKEGEITAFLHLDMDNLGPVDVFVSLKEQAVKTKFTVADETIIDFLEEHMDILNARLQKRGYTVSSAVVSKETAEDEQAPASMIERILTQKANVPMLAHYSFDARA